MDNTVAVIEKYKSRLHPDNEFKKVLRALQKLNEIEMTIELLQATGIGKCVNSLRKKEGLGEFAKEIVNKWKRLISNGTRNNVEEKRKSRSPPPQQEYTPGVKSEPVEYDPAQNWEMEKASSYKPSVKQEQIEDDEYDPSQNWQMESSYHEEQSDPVDAETYVPSSSPVKAEKHSPPRHRKKKKHENSRKDDQRYYKPDPGIDREAEELKSLHETQKEMKKRKKEKKRKNEMKIKAEKVSPERNPTYEDEEINGDVEEYDPDNNYELSPTNYDPSGSPESNQEYDPSSQGGNLEYDPGPADSDAVNYKPSSNLTYDPGSEDEMTYDPGSSGEVAYKPGSPEVNEQLQNGYNSESSYEEDEPGAYLLHPRRASSDFNRRSSGHSEASPPQEEENEPADTSYVQSTTLYSRNKSVDSEDGNWGSKVKIERVTEEENAFSSQRTENHKIKKKKHKKTDLEEKSISISEKNSTKKHKKSMSDKNTVKKSSEKRKSMSAKSEEPAKKKVKSSEVKSDKSETKTSKDKTKSSKKLSKVKGESSKGTKIEPKDAGFLFQDIPDETKLRKKKKKGKNAQIVTPTIRKQAPKLDLHLPEIQPTYRPLPHSGGDSVKRRKSGEMKLTDNQAAELHSQRQTKKMLVYSGGSGGFIPKMMSLYDQCMGVLMNNIDAIDAFGGIPYEIVKPILNKCTWEQLYRLEDSNPYLLEDTDKLWKEHSQHEFRAKRPSELESWREMFLRLVDEREAKLHNLTAMIQAKEAKKKPLEKKVLLAYVGTNAKAPRNVRRAQEKYGTGIKPRPSSSHSMNRSSTGHRSVASAVRREIVDSRMAIPEGTITAATVDREQRMAQIKEMKKPRVAPMMAKTLKSIGRLKFRR